MRKNPVVLLYALALLCLSPLSPASAASASHGIPAWPKPSTQSEWTFLIFLNGNNNLDSYGAVNLNQMEKVGSTKNVNIVVQWASLANGKVQRVHVKKDEDASKVTSPILEDLGKVDMGDWKNLVEFVRWGVQKFPAKHYFIDVWNHGNGWHKLQLDHGGMPVHSINDISYDDISGNHITTEQLGQAMAESAKIIGHKVDLYGSDACLMAMAEVSSEMADSVSYFVGAQEVEPAAGWPYDDILKRWVAKPAVDGGTVAKILVEEYTKSYQGGQNGNMEVTMSAFDLTKTAALESAIAKLAADVSRVDADDKAKVVASAQNTINFTYSDYGDVVDFVNQLEKNGARGIDLATLASVKGAVGEFVIANAVTPRYERAKGLSIWLPSESWTFDRYKERYKGMQLHKKTQWADALAHVLQSR